LAWRRRRITSTSDTSKARDVLGWTPTTSLEQLIDEMMAFEFAMLQAGH